MTFFEKMNTRPGYAIRSLINFVLLYLIASVAIDTGSLLMYGLGILLFILGTMNLYSAITYKGTSHKR